MLLIGKYKIYKINRDNFFKYVLLECMEEIVGRIVLLDVMIVYVIVLMDFVFVKMERRDI